MSGNPTTGAAPSANELDAVLAELVAEIQDRDVHEVAAAIASGASATALDSLDAVELLVALEERFGIRFPDDAVVSEALETVEGLATYVRRLVEETTS